MPALDLATLEAGLGGIAAAPPERGRLEAIVRRPEQDRRELLDRGRLHLELGLEGDDWSRRADPRRDWQGPLLDAQLTVMSSRAARLVSDSPDPADWAPAGDQLFVDIDLSGENLPAGTRLGIGATVIEVTAEPHHGCGSFARRFGVEALKFVNSEAGRRLRLRGINARVIAAGEIAVGDEVVRLGGSG